MPSPVEWLDAFQTNTTGSGPGGDTQNEPAIVSLDTGHFVVLWQDDSDGGPGSGAGTDILGQVYDPLGNAVGAEFRASQGVATNDETNPSVAALPGGRFVVVFESADAGGTSLLATEWTTGAGGVISSVTRTIQAQTVETVLSDPSVAAQEDGSYVVAYQSEDTTAGQTDTEVVAVTAGGTVGAAQTTPLSGFDSRTDNVSIAALAGGGYTLAIEYVLASDGIAFNLIDSSGSPSGSSSVAGNTNINGKDDFDAVTVGLANGGFVVAWAFTDANDTDIAFQIFDSDGTALGAIQNAGNDSATDLNTDPQLVALDDGGFMILYEDGITGTVFGERFTETGDRDGTPLEFGVGVGASDPAVTRLQDGRVAVGWAAPDGSGSDILVEIVDPREGVITVPVPGGFVTGRPDGSTIRGSSAGDEIYALDGNDEIVTYGGNDTIRTGDGIDFVRAGDGDDSVTGGEDNDAIFGNSGNDVIDGKGGDDILNGQFGMDTLDGGTGNDTLVGGGGDDTVVAGDGNDYVNSGPGADLVLGQAGNDTLIGGAQSDILNGGAGADLLIGQIGNDSMLGGSGDDTLNGGNNADTLEGGGGADLLRGQDGFDVLDGGAGNGDVMTGGAGNDSFVFAAGYGSDRITDFTDGDDALLLGEALWGGGLTAQQVVDGFATVSGGATVFDFSGGNVLTLDGLLDAQGLVDDIVFV